MIPEKRVGMHYIKVILFMNIGLTFATTTVEGLSDYYQMDAAHLPENAYPTHYILKLVVNTDTLYLNHTGLVIIQIHILSPTYYVFLNAKSLEIIVSETMLVNDQGSFTMPSTIENEDHILAISFEKEVPPGNYSLMIKFQSIPTNNFYESNVHNKTMTIEQNENVILTQFGKIAARQLFPCWDHPSFKATFNITVKHSQKYTALSNMPLLKRQNNSNTNFAYSIFATTPMMSTHQLVIVLMPNAITDPQATVFIWCKSDMISTIYFAYNISDKVPKHLFRYISLTNISSVIQKTDQVVISDAPYSEAHWGLLIYRESDIIYDEKKDSVSVKTKVANTVATQVARQVFGGLITPEWWSHSWLTESFALFFSRYVLDQMYDEWIEIFFTVVEDLHVSLNKDEGLLPPVLFQVETISEILSLRPTFDVYRKGSALLRMLQQIMGEETFRKGVIEYVNRHKYGVVTSDDLWSAMQTALNATSKPTFDVKKVMDTWITQKGFPLVIVQRNYETGITTISQQPYKPFNIEFEHYKWWIPVTYTVESYPAFDYSYPTLWLEPTENKTVSILMNSADWIIVNVQQSGYYRVWYDRTNWDKIAFYLHFKDYSIIHVLNRAQIIDDICYTFKNEQADWTLFAYVTSYLSREIDYIPWIPMLRCLDTLSVFFSLPESKKFQMYFASYFNFILKEIEYEENPKDPNDDDLTRKGRQNLAFYACDLGNPTCRNTAADKLKKHLEDPTIYEILPWWQNWTFCFGLKTENASIWDQVYQLYAETKKKTILNYLPCTENPNIIIHLLHTIVRNNTLIEETDQANLFNTIIKQHIGNNEIFFHIMNNIMILKPNSISLNNALDTIIMNIYSEQQLDILSNHMILIIDSHTREAKNYKIKLQRQKIQALKRNFDKIFPNKI